MEINKPGGFLLAAMKRMSGKDERDMIKSEDIKIEDIENKIKLLNQKGVVTYGFKRGFDNDFVSEELYDDLRIFEDVGWIKIDFSNPHCKLTDRGKQIVKEIEIPEIVKDKFESVFK